MRIRSLALVLLVSGTAALALTACSGKPENSPAIRKKFAEVDKTTQTVEQMTAEIALLNEQVKRLTDENSELRTFLPTIDGAAATDKLSTLEARLSKLESMTGSSALAMATTTPAAASTTSTTPAETSAISAPAASTDATRKLEDAPLAALAKPVVVASQQEKPAAKPAEQKTSAPAAKPTFKEKTKPTTTKATSTTTAKAEPAAAKPAATRGKYYEIQSGDTIDSIAKANSVSADEIMKANRLPKGARLARGQRLFIPAK